MSDSKIKQVTKAVFKKTVKAENDAISSIIAGQVTLLSIYNDFCEAHGLLKDNGLPTQAGKDIALAFSAPAMVKEYGSYPCKDDSDKLVSLDDAARKHDYFPAVFMRNCYISLRKQQRANEDAQLTPEQKQAKKDKAKKGADKKKGKDTAIVVKKNDIDAYIAKHPEAFFAKHEAVFEAMVKKFDISDVNHPLFDALTTFGELAQTITAQVESK